MKKISVLITILFLFSGSSTNANDISRHFEQEKKKTVEVDAKTLQTYVGKYKLRADQTINISLVDGSLFITSNRQDHKTRLLPKSEQQFFVAENSAQITFNKGEKGEIISLTINNGRGKVLTASKL